MLLHILDQSFRLTGVIDEFISLIWRPAYYSVGDFELYINATSEAVALLQKNYYLVRDKDIIVDGAGNVTYKNVMIIKNIELQTDAESGDHLIYTGRELKFLLHQRIIWKQTNLNSKVEYAMRKLVSENAIAPTDPKRAIPDLTLAAEHEYTESVRKQVTGAQLDEALTEIAQTYNYGWEVYIYNASLVFDVYKGVNRSYSQTERPYVVFNDEFDNILNSNYVLNTEEYADTVLVAGEGEGVSRITATVGGETAGLDRYETYVDARDLSQNKDSEDEITLEEYTLLLQERGAESLAEKVITEAFTGEVQSEISFVYGKDFFLGDTVTVRNQYGISKDVMVLSAIESEDESGSKLIPQFNI